MQERLRYQYVRTPDPVYIEDKDEADDWCDYFMSRDAVGYDTETTGLDPIRTRIKFFGFADTENRICCPVRLLESFRPVLENRNIRKRMSNAKVDMHWTANHGIIIRGPLDDSVVADFFWDENRRGQHGLKETSRDHLRLRMRSFKTVFGDVGKTDHEVETLCRIHDILEGRLDEDATDMLVFLGQAEGDVEVLKALRKLYMSVKAGHVLKPRALLKIARDFGLTTRTSGTKGFVVDFLRLVDSPKFFLLPKDRAEYEPLLEEKHLIEDAHKVIADELRSLVKVDRDPLDLLRLTVGDYASLDPWASNQLFDDFYIQELQAFEMYRKSDGTSYSLWNFFEDDAVPYTRVLWNMERRGFAIDLKSAGDLDRPLREQINKLDRTITGLVGFELNPDSAPALRNVFYHYDAQADTWADAFGEPVMHWTKGGSTGIKLPSTDKKALERFEELGHPLAKAVLEYRVLAKLRGTYVENMPSWVDHRRRVHTTLKQGGAVTYRLASSDPNLQNIPARSELGHKIRHLFVPGTWGDCDPMCCMDELMDVPVPDLPPDFPMTLVVADYKQLEMRIMAHFSEDPNMIKAIMPSAQYPKGMDLHCWTGHLAQGVLKAAGLAKFDFDYDMLLAAKNASEEKGRKLTDFEKVLCAIRDAMKAVGFGLIYGIGAVKLGRQLGLPVTESVNRRTGRLMYKCPQAEKMIEGYFAAYPGVKEFIDQTHATCEAALLVSTNLGRPRRLPDILSEDRGISSQAQRQSVNSIIQGSAADITNEAMLACEMCPELRRLGVRMLLQVHDELIFEVPNHPDFLVPAMAQIKKKMTNPFQMLVPIDISISTGPSWGAAK